MKKDLHWREDLRRARWLGLIFYLFVGAISAYGLYRHNHGPQLVALVILVTLALPLTAYMKAKGIDWFMAYWIDVGAFSYIVSSLAFKHQSPLEGTLIPIAALIGGAFLLFWERGVRNKRREEMDKLRNTNLRRY